MKHFFWIFFFPLLLSAQNKVQHEFALNVTDYRYHPTHQAMRDKFSLKGGAYGIRYKGYGLKLGHEVNEVPFTHVGMVIRCGVGHHPLGNEIGSLKAGTNKAFSLAFQKYQFKNRKKLEGYSYAEGIFEDVKRLVGYGGYPQSPASNYTLKQKTVRIGTGLGLTYPVFKSKSLSFVMEGGIEGIRSDVAPIYCPEPQSECDIVVGYFSQDGIKIRPKAKAAFQFKL